MTRVVALQDGHDGRFFRNAGEVFDVDLKDARFKGATWFVIEGKEPALPVIDPNAPPPGAGPAKGSAIGADAPAGDSIA